MSCYLEKYPRAWWWRVSSEARALIVYWAPDWSINGTPGPLIGCCFVQTDLINSSSDDTFRVSRCKTQDNLLWRKSSNYQIWYWFLNLPPKPQGSHIMLYTYNYTMQCFISMAGQCQAHTAHSHQIQALIWAWLSSSLFIIFHGTRQMELIVSAHFQKLNLDF